MGNFTVTQTSFNAGELSPYMSARLDQARRGSGCKTLKNMLIAPHGAVYRRSGLRFMGESLDHSTAEKDLESGMVAKLSGAKIKLIPFVFNEDQAYVLEFGPGKMRIWHKGGLVVNPDTKAPIVVNTPFASEILPYLRCCQSADVMYLVNPEITPHKLLRYSHIDWRLVPMGFAGTLLAPQNVKGFRNTSGSTNHTYVVTSVGKSGEESLASVPVSVAGASALSASVTVSVMWAAATDAVSYKVYKQGGGAGVFGLISTGISGLFFSDTGQVVNFSQSPPKPSSPFNGTGNYPSCVQFFQQRLCFASSKNAPQTLWMSRAGTYENFNVSSPLRADDAIIMTLAAEKVNSIRWLMPGKRLLVGTVDGEWSIAGRGGEPISPLACEAERQSARGSAEIHPQAVGDSVLFVQRGGNLVREFRYNLEVDGYAGADITILAEHLFRNRSIVDWSFQQNPHSVVWCVLDNGALVGLTLISEHQVAGWHQHETNGLFEGLCCIPGKQGDELWAVVTRETIDPQSGLKTHKRYIERLDEPFNADDSSKAFFIDSGLSYSGEPVESVIGLEHLEGLEVSILADGWVHPPLRVKNGSVSLRHKASNIHVGLAYQSDLGIMSVEAATESGICLAAPRRAIKAMVRVLRSAGFKMGSTEESLREVNFRELAHELGKPLPLYSGDYTANLHPQIVKSSSLTLRQEDPLPLTVLATSLEIELGLEN